METDKNDKNVAIGDECNKFEWFKQLDISSQWAFKKFGICEDDLKEILE